jgi:hypothetical protein
MQVVLDSSNLNAVIRDATGEGVEAPELPMSSGALNAAGEAADAAKAAQKPAEAAAEKPEGDEKGESKASEDDPDDVEGPDGLTPREKRDLTAKMQAAIGKRTRALREAEAFAADQYNQRRLAEQRAEQLEREINRFKAQLEGDKPAEPVVAAKPDRKNFETDDAYQDAVIDWKVEQRVKADREAAAQQAEAQRQAEMLAQAKARIERAKELVPDFAEITGAVDKVVPAHIAGYMQESELFAEIAYHFAQHPEDLDRVAAMTPARSLVEIGKIESKLSPFAPAAKVENGDKPSKSNGAKPSTETGSAPSKPRVSAPIIPINSGSAVQVEKAASERSLEDEKAAFQKRHGINFGKRQRH